MSNEELFAAIHKSKKKLNIKLNENDNENLSPCGSMNSLAKTPAGTRHSWSPESPEKASSEVIINTSRNERAKISDLKMDHIFSLNFYSYFSQKNCFFFVNY